MSRLDDLFHYTWTGRYVCTLDDVWDIKNFEIWSILQKSGRLDVIWVQRVGVFDVALNHIKIRRKHDFVRYNNEAMMVDLDKINDFVRFDALRSVVETSNIFTWENHKLVYIITTYRNNDLFAW